MTLRPIAIYLPQFHPIPENDEWWGKGFTEWTNVTKAKPLYRGHYQPHLPADLGFYDLRLGEARQAQADLAREHGIYGFCYYHYWFNGKRILERPFQEVFESGKPDFPFMLCWANENWTRTWDGSDKEILLGQHYSEEDDRLHIRTLIPYFKDERYIRINNKPVIAIYRSGLLPDCKRTTDTWREEAKKEGLELYITRFENFGNSGKQYLVNGGFDSGIDFQPSQEHLFSFYLKMHKIQNKNLLTKLCNISKRSYYYLFDRDKHKLLVNSKYIIDYEEYVNHIIECGFPDYNWMPCVTPMWDNYARRKKGYVIFKNSTPETYFKWLNHIVKNYSPHSKEENFVFINAWNEWAEGNHLEPCLKWGNQYLQKTSQVFKGDKKN